MPAERTRLAEDRRLHHGGWAQQARRPLPIAEDQTRFLTLAQLGLIVPLTGTDVGSTGNPRDDLGLRSRGAESAL